jgi:hypothetical protein
MRPEYEEIFFLQPCVVTNRSTHKKGMKNFLSAAAFDLGESAIPIPYRVSNEPPGEVAANDRDFFSSPEHRFRWYMQ